jgi:hypothetical protein
MDCDPNNNTHGGAQDYLIGLWSAQLNRADVRIGDDFFESGGSSMQAIEMLMTVSATFNRDIDYAAFFKSPCIRTLSGLLISDTTRA